MNFLLCPIIWTDMCLLTIITCGVMATANQKQDVLTSFFSGLVPFLHTSQSTTSSCLSLVVLGKGPNPTQC